MARLPLPSRRGRDEEEGVQPPPPPPRRATPPAGVLRRERRVIVRAREQGLRDLGGLLLEMYRRDLFREDLLREHCAELLSLDARLHEIDLLLSGRHPGYVGRCDCGAPILWGSHFCANCGRPAGGGVVVACTRCGHPLPADARFCASCGLLAEAQPALVAVAEPEAEPEPEPEPEPAATNCGEPEAARAGADPWES